MSQIVSFPGLGLEFNISPILFQIGTLQIRWYGVVIALGFLLGMIYVMRRANKFGVSSDKAFDIVLGSLIAGVIGARLYYVAFMWEEMFKADPIKVFYIWEGGIAIYGGLIAAFLVAILLCKKMKVNLLSMFDLACPAVLLAQGIGRWGNFFNVEAFGVNTTMPWGMTSPSIQAFLQQNMQHFADMGIAVDPALPVHPTFLYESIFNIIGFFVLAFLLAPRRKFDGQVFLCYAGWYGAVRYFVEGLRTDSLMWGNIRVSQAFAAICVFATIAGLYLLAKRAKASLAADSTFSPLYVNSTQWAEELAAEENNQEKAAKANDELAQAIEEGDDAIAPPAEDPLEETIEQDIKDETPDIQDDPTAIGDKSGDSPEVEAIAELSEAEQEEEDQNHKQEGK